MAAGGDRIPGASDDDRGAQAAITAKYDGEAPSYDRARSGLFFDLAGEIVADMAGPCDARHVLDCPVGTGRIMPYLSGVANAERYVGIDIARGMLRAARGAAAREGVGRYGDALGSLWKLPFASSQFDLVLILRLFHLFPPDTYAEALREVHRVLRPGGVVIAEMRNQHRGVVVGNLRRWLDARNPKELPHYYIRPAAITAAFGPLRVVESRGYWFDGSQIAQRFARPAARRVNLALARGPARFLASELVVKAVKDG